MVKCDVKDSMDVVSGANKCDCLISRSDKYFEITSKVPLLHPQIGMLPIFDCFLFAHANQMVDNVCTLGYSINDNSIINYPCYLPFLPIIFSIVSLV